MRSIKYLSMAMLLLVSAMIWGQSVYLESGGETITLICESSETYQFIGTNT